MHSVMLKALFDLLNLNYRMNLYFCGLEITSKMEQSCIETPKAYVVSTGGFGLVNDFCNFSDVQFADRRGLYIISHCFFNVSTFLFSLLVQ